MERKAGMNNPWLHIPADDYVGHMSSPEVGQYQVLKEILRDALVTLRPRSVLVLGCGTGNGFEHIDAAQTTRVVGVDINPDYLQRLGEHFPHPSLALELRCSNLATCTFERDAFDLIHAALVFEYLDWPQLLPRAADALGRRGVLSLVLQRPSSAVPAVTPTPFSSLRALESIFHFVNADDVMKEATALGLDVDYRKTERLASGKALEVLRFRKPAI